MNTKNFGMRYFVVGVVLLCLSVYGLNRGIFVGSENIIMGAPCCPNLDVIQKECRYLFVTGISAIPAKQGQMSIADLLKNSKQKLAAAGFSDAEISKWANEEKQKGADNLLSKRPDMDSGYCPLFGD